MGVEGVYGGKRKEAQAILMHLLKPSVREVAQSFY